MKSENYRQLLNNERDSLEMTADEYNNTLIHFAKLYHQEQQCNIAYVVGQSEQFYCDDRDKYGNTDCGHQCMMCVREE